MFYEGILWGGSVDDEQLLKTSVGIHMEIGKRGGEGGGGKEG